MSQMVKTRNIVCSEYYRQKMELKDKKLNMRNDVGDLDFESLHRCKLERADVAKDPKLRLKFVLPEVGSIDHSKLNRSGSSRTTVLYSTTTFSMK